jgi:hypothetical protein
LRLELGPIGLGGGLFAPCERKTHGRPRKLQARDPKGKIRACFRIFLYCSHAFRSGNVNQVEYEDKIRDLCRRLIDAQEPGEIERLSEELRSALRQQIQEARHRIQEVAPLLPRQNPFKKAC